MASTIVTKNSSTASAVPVSGDLTQGELAVNVTDKKLYTKDSGGTVVKLVGGLGNQEANAVAITGGSINGTTVGATTASTGAFTTLSASSTTTLSGGTANGVAYLNGSKVVTTGSALTFDGTNLTVGTGASTYKLNVYGASSPYLGVSDGTINTFFGAATGGSIAALGTTSNHPVSFYSNSAEQMRLTSTGLGIGTSSPVDKLEVYSTITARAASGTSALRLRNTTSDYQWQTVAGTNAINLYDNAVGFSRLTVDSSGNLGIGTSSPTVNLHVYNASSAEVRIASANIGLQLYSSEGAGTSVIGTYTNHALVFRTNATERARIDSSGRFAIAVSGNTYSQDAGLTVNGTGFTRAIYTNINGTASSTHCSFANGNGVVGSITTSGTATAYNTSSDYRLKNIDGPLTGSGDFIDALKPRVGTWKSDGSKFVGFLAHEVQEVSPQTVVGEKDAVDKEGNPIMQAMEYGSAEFIANIIAELQSLRKRLSALEGK